MIGPTKRQKEMLDAIQELTIDGISPTYHELSAKLGLKGRGQVAWLLEKLKEKGLVDWEPNRARSLKVLKQGYDGMAAEVLQAKIREASEALAARMGASVAAAVLRDLADELERAR